MFPDGPVHAPRFGSRILWAGPAEARSPIQRAVAQFGRAPVSKTGGWGFESLRPCPEEEMNRQTKRMMQRDRRQQAAVRRPPVAERKKRVGPAQFFREVRQELKKVAWPTRRELLAYTVVVLASVVVLTSFVFGLDFLISKAVLALFGVETG